MPTLVRDLKLDLDTPESALPKLAARRLGWSPDELAQLVVRRRSLDARRGRPLRFIYSVEVTRRGEPDAPSESPAPPVPVPTSRATALPPPVIVGAGPAGLFAALYLAERGLRPILLERGQPIRQRHEDVRRLRVHGELDPESNICFGEGGAGTYSDGKLFTRKRGPAIRKVIERLIAHGADPAIAVDAHPHIGSNRLSGIVERVRDDLRSLGAALRFGARVDRLIVEDGVVTGVVLEDGERVDASAVVLATGHAARDVYARLVADGVAVAPKGFAVGLRVEHPQPLIDRIQYGKAAGHVRLPAADYRLARQVGDRGVYSFCMCPGGYIVPTPVEPRGLAVNGMSNSRRGSPHANSALVVELRAEELAPLSRVEGPLAGVALQRRLEAEAYRLGGGGFRAPAQRVTDFLDGRKGDLPRSASYRPGLRAAQLRGLLPPTLEDALAHALGGFGRALRGFVTEDAILVGVESMTSAPLTILRDPERLESLSHPGLFPAGEGAGHAGGITSSAADGERVAAALLKARYGVDEGP